MAEIKIKADSNGGTVSLKGPAATTGDAAIQLTLPVGYGAADQFLKTNGSGALSWAAAGSPSIDDNGDATAITIDSSERVGIGTTDPGTRRVKIEHTTDTPLQLHSTQSNCYIQLGNSSATNGYLGFETTNLTFHNNGKKAEIDTSGDLKINAGNLVIGTSGKGIYLGGSGSSNHLTDYEQGSWDATCDNSVTLTHDELFYTKIGRLVHVCGYLTVNSDNSNAAFVVNNLPFAANSGFGLSSPHMRLHNWNIDSDCKWVSGYTEANKIHFQQNRDDGNNPALAADSGAVMILNLSYYQN